MNKNILTLVAMLPLILNGCTTYHITTESLVEQFSGAPMERKTDWVETQYINLPIREGVDVNTIKEIKVLDKNGKEHTLTLTYQASIKITQNSGAKTTFYLNTIHLADSAIGGSKTHFFNWKIKPIKLSNIHTIKVRKNS